jgi:hypothetical protein
MGIQGLSRFRNVLTATVFVIAVMQGEVSAAERDLVIEPLTSGSFAVGSTNFTTSDSAVSQLLNEELDAGSSNRA